MQEIWTARSDWDDARLDWDRVIHWADSENVYYWERYQSHEFKRFVDNRIGEIQRTTSPA